MTRWLRAMPGCRFATHLLSGDHDQRVVLAAFDGIAPSIGVRLSRHFAAQGNAGRAGVVVFPSIDSETQLVELLVVLAHDERWSYKEHVDPNRSGMLITLEWRTDHDDWSNVMGFAPLFSMPLTRRAPYVALACWPGPPRRASKKGEVGLIDIPSPFEGNEHDRAFASTTERAQSLLREDPNAAPWRQVAFCLSESNREHLFGTST